MEEKHAGRSGSHSQKNLAIQDNQPELKLSAEQAAAYSIKLVEFNLYTFTALISAFGPKSKPAGELGPIWNYLDFISTFFIGVAQCLDTRKHRQTARKLKGASNMMSSPIFIALTAVDFPVFGGPVFAASCGLAFAHSVEDVMHYWRRIHDPGYWLADAISEKEKLNAQIEALEALSQVRFLGEKRSKKINELRTQKAALEADIGIYKPGSPLPTKILKKCCVDFTKALIDSFALGNAFIAMAIACTMSLTELPVVIPLAIAGVLFFSKHSGLVEKLATEVAGCMVPEEAGNKLNNDGGNGVPSSGSVSPLGGDDGLDGEPSAGDHPGESSGSSPISVH